MRRGEALGPSVKACVQTVCNYMNRGPESGFFVVGVVSATVFVPVEEALKLSPQTREYLHPEPLKGHEIIHSSRWWVRRLIDDTGGHGRAMEALKQTLQDYSVDHQFDERRETQDFFQKIFATFGNRLIKKYPAWVGSDVISSGKWLSLFKNVIARRPFFSLKDLVVEGYTVEDVVNLGLLSRFPNEEGPLEVPFALCLLLSESLARNRNTEASVLPALLRERERERERERTESDVCRAHLVKVTETLLSVDNS